MSRYRILAVALLPIALCFGTRVTMAIFWIMLGIVVILFLSLVELALISWVEGRKQ
jgi:hypothetical protein